MADGPAFEFVQYKYDKRRQDEAQVEENKAKKAKKDAEDSQARRAVGQLVVEEIKKKNELPVKLTRPQLLGVAELLGCHEDVKKLKVPEIRDHLEAKARVEGWLKGDSR